jgi:PAS domain S-box-containing protein
MIVEDETIVAYDIQSRLTRLGYDVVDIFSTGEEAIAKVQDLAPDLILMDIMLAGELDGVKTAEQIRRRFDLPVIFLTAYADEKTLQAAKLTEPYGYVLKPFEERELHSNIEMGLYRHQLEREIKESRQWFATTLKCIGDAVIATNTKGEVAFMNAVAEALTGWQEAEALGKDLTAVFDIVNETTRAPVENPGLRALRDGVITGLANHTVLIAKGGKEFPIDDSAAPIRDERGHIIGVVLVFRDVTERKQAEDQIRRYNEELEALVRQRTAQIQQLERQRVENEKLVAIGRMAARIAHEINNPLAGIKNSFVLLKDYVPREAPDYEFVPLLEKEIDRITEIIRQMFNLYRPDRNVTKAFPVNEAVRDVVALVKPAANEHNARIVVNTRVAAEAKVKSEGTLRQILFNLIRNAIEASPAGGETTVTVSASEGMVTIAVADQGTGIPEAIQSQIFEPFFTTKSGNTTGGLGLGLSISKSLAEASGGSIHFQNQKDRGTVFYFSLPLVTTTEA